MPQYFPKSPEEHEADQVAKSLRDEFQQKTLSLVPFVSSMLETSVVDVAADYKQGENAQLVVRASCTDDRGAYTNLLGELLENFRGVALKSNFSPGPTAVDGAVFVFNGDAQKIMAGAQKCAIQAAPSS